MVTVGSYTTAEYLGIWLVEGSNTTSWISNNSPNSLNLSGLTEGKSFLTCEKFTRDHLKEGTNYTTWEVGGGESNEFTYGDDIHVRTFTRKCDGTGIAGMYTEKAKVKRFKKRHNRNVSYNVYMFNRYDTSAAAYETFYDQDVSAKKYVRVIILNIDYNWEQQTNLKTIASITVKEIWHS